MPGLAGGQHPDLIEPQLLNGRTHQGHMGLVRGVKGPAKHSHTADGLGRQTQSRGTR